MNEVVTLVWLFFSRKNRSLTSLYICRVFGDFFLYSPGKYCTNRWRFWFFPQHPLQHSNSCISSVNRRAREGFFQSRGCAAKDTVNHGGLRASCITHLLISTVSHCFRVFVFYVLALYWIIFFFLLSGDAHCAADDFNRTYMRQIHRWYEANVWCGERNIKHYYLRSF